MLSSSAFLLKNIVKLAVSIAIDFSFQINRSIEKNWSWRVRGVEDFGPRRFSGDEAALGEHGKGLILCIAVV